MRIRGIVVFGLSAAIGVFLLFSWIQRQGPERLDGDLITIGVQQEWEFFCVSGQYEIPDIPIGKTTGATCWSGGEVPSGTLFLTYVLRSGDCVRQVVQGSFLQSGLSETRCFEQSEISGSILKRENGIFEFQDGE